MIIPKVSIITPTFNSKDFIEHTIRSVIDQTYQNWELIIVDDASKDNTIEIINEFVSVYPNIRLLQNKENNGAAISRNKAIEAAKGDYIAFLDADDLWKPEKLEKQIAFMEENKCDVCFSSYELMNEKGELLHQEIRALTSLSYKKLVKSNYVGNLTGIFNARTLGKITSVNLRKRQDWLIWLEAIKKSGKPALGIQEPLAIYRVRESSISSNKLNLVKYNYWVYKKGLGFSTLKSMYSLVIFLFEHFFVKSKQKVNLN
ncbi:glycosyltransferase family 2 protein [Seonamhaeicola marinus]|uniref:Glycosyltransferase family 2 protein n=1 Tax=Seonamhaeicola marinus TaxID=1912246 RepID=A0A5D0HSP1_9FLAO|nr:glycosyltransferase family 2 protein [Seonamhaeicola marinus]TYA74121.1 glycosyltransferase family 2 protein [Seonamhaeicola marinus]